MTNHWVDLKNSKCLMVFSNPAENHPSCMQWINDAKRNNDATVIVVDPRKTRMTAVADYYVRIRPGTDTAFINGILKRLFVRVDAATTSSYTMAAATSYPGSPGEGFYMRAVHQIDTWTTNFFNDESASYMTGLLWPAWTDALFRTNEGYNSVTSGQPNDYLRYGRDVTCGDTGDPNYTNDPNYSTYQGSATKRAWANQNQVPVLAGDLNAGSAGTGSHQTQTVYQVLKGRVSGYDSDTVNTICGCGTAEFEQAADTYLDNSWCNDPKPSSDYKAASILYAMGTTQHTNASQTIKGYCNLQICTGNIGKHGGGVNAMRGIGNVQGSTDQALLYHLAMGYIGNPYKVKIKSVTSSTKVVTDGKPSLYSHNWSADNSSNGFSGNYASGNAQSETVCRVLLTNSNGFLKGTASTYTYSGGIAGCGAAVKSVTSGPGTGEYTIETYDSLGSPVAGDYLSTDYETWIYSKSFGGKNVYASTGGNNYASPLKWSGGIPWGHVGTFAFLRTVFSEGYAGNAGGATSDAPTGAAGALNYLYNNYMPKGNGMDHRSIFTQTKSDMPGYSSSKPQVKGMVIWGQNPRVTESNSANIAEKGLENLDWLAVVEMFMTETADATRKTGGVTYFLPAASFAETAGTLSTSSRMLQWRYQALSPSGTKTDMEILFKLARALHIKADIHVGYGTGNGETAYQKLWRDQYAGDGTGAGILSGIGWVESLASDKKSLPDPATAWDNAAYKATYQGEDAGTGQAAAGFPGYAERVYIQMSTASQDRYGNAGTNWLQGSSTQAGGGNYGAWRDPDKTAGNFTDYPPTKNALYTPDSTEDAKANRSQARSQNDSSGSKGLCPGFGWVWLRNRRNFYNKGGFCPGDITDIFVGPDEVAALFIGTPSSTTRPPVVSYTGTWRASRSLSDAIDSGQTQSTWAKAGYTPVHWEPHETTKSTLLSRYGTVGNKSVGNYVNTEAERDEFPLTLTTFRHTEHYQGGAMTRNIPLLNELVPNAQIELNSADAGDAGIQFGDNVYIMSLRSCKKTTVDGDYVGGTTLNVSSVTEADIEKDDYLLVGDGVSVTLAADVTATSTTLTVTGIGTGTNTIKDDDKILVGAGLGTVEEVQVNTVSGTTITLKAGLLGDHVAGEWVNKEESTVKVDSVAGNSVTLASALRNTHSAGVKVYNVGNPTVTPTTTKGWIGPWKAFIGTGSPDNQRIGVGVVGVPWHWGSKAISTGPTANDLTIDAQDVNTTMPETKVALCKIKKA